MLLPRPQSELRCSYCGQPLAPGFYFCTACAMPHRDVEEVVPEVRPAQWDDETLIRREAPQAWRLFLIYVGAMIACAIVGLLLFPENDGSVPRMVIGLLTVAGVSAVFGVAHRDVLSPQFGGAGVANMTFLYGLLLLAAALLLNLTYHGILWRMMPESLRKEGFDDVINLVPSIPGRIMLICLMPAIFEEIGFRGLIQTWLMRVISPWKAIAVAGGLFSAVHFTILSAPYLFLAGCLFGWVRWRTGRLLPAMILHFLHNLGVLWYLGLLHQNPTP